MPITAFVMAYIRCSAAVLNANSNIPVELVTMLQAVIALFVAAEESVQDQTQGDLQHSS